MLLKKIIIIKNFPENQNFNIYKGYIQFKIFIQFFHKRKKIFFILYIVISKKPFLSIFNFINFLL